MRKLINKITGVSKLEEKVCALESRATLHTSQIDTLLYCVNNLINENKKS